MQLGTRWAVGAEPPASLPAEVRGAIAGVELELAEEGVDAAAWRWTLTWLEGRPVAQLDDGTTIRVDPASGEARVTQED
ncbi:hypothetical protein [Homoserinibacter sp. YIM 151385]|uniref:hypothetical protein n=1 Tax=Homoserinibacter sp. YIM 151385 TaxID=2985506 RepID=UPI0022F095D1|nr:hypothetical protein [Homoserinibacter sp. YIM 151385]WBU39004.1 hypothetical protein OF852_05335 [Homoserinibacter sp. YIM 151385]